MGPHPNQIYSPLFSAYFGHSPPHTPHPGLPGLLTPFWLGLAKGMNWQELKGGEEMGLGISPSVLGLLWPSSRAGALSLQVHGSCQVAPPPSSSDFLPASAPGQVTAPHGGRVLGTLPSWSVPLPSFP